MKRLQQLFDTLLFTFKYFTKRNLQFVLNFGFSHSWEWKGYVYRNNWHVTGLSSQTSWNTTWSLKREQKQAVEALLLECDVVLFSQHWHRCLCEYNSLVISPLNNNITEERKLLKWMTLAYTVHTIESTQGVLKRYFTGKVLNNNWLCHPNWRTCQQLEHFPFPRGGTLDFKWQEGTWMGTQL